MCVDYVDAVYTFQSTRVEHPVLPWQLTTEHTLVCAAELAGMGAATHTHTHTQSAKATREDC